MTELEANTEFGLEYGYNVSYQIIIFSLTFTVYVVHYLFYLFDIFGVQTKRLPPLSLSTSRTLCKLTQHIYHFTPMQRID